MCRLLGIEPYSLQSHVILQLRYHLNHIQREDRELLWEGVESLTHDELVEACKDRAMMFYDISDQDMREEMRQWLQISSHKDIPPLLLLWCRCITLTHHPIPPPVSTSTSSSSSPLSSSSPGSLLSSLPTAPGEDSLEKSASSSSPAAPTRSVVSQDSKEKRETPTSGLSSTSSTLSSQGEKEGDVHNDKKKKSGVSEKKEESEVKPTKKRLLELPSVLLAGLKGGGGGGDEAKGEKAKKGGGGEEEEEEKKYKKKISLEASDESGRNGEKDQQEVEGGGAKEMEKEGEKTHVKKIGGEDDRKKEDEDEDEDERIKKDASLQAIERQVELLRAEEETLRQSVLLLQQQEEEEKRKKVQAEEEKKKNSLASSSTSLFLSHAFSPSASSSASSSGEKRREEEKDLHSPSSSSPFLSTSTAEKILSSSAESERSPVSLELEKRHRMKMQEAGEEGRESEKEEEVEQLHARMAEEGKKKRDNSLESGWCESTQDRASSSSLFSDGGLSSSNLSSSSSTAGGDEGAISHADDHPSLNEWMKMRSGREILQRRCRRMELELRLLRRLTDLQHNQQEDAFNALTRLLEVAKVCRLKQQAIESLKNLSVDTSGQARTDAGSNGGRASSIQLDEKRREGEEKDKMKDTSLVSENLPKEQLGIREEEVLPESTKSIDASTHAKTPGDKIKLQSSIDFVQAVDQLEEKIQEVIETFAQGVKEVDDLMKEAKTLQIDDVDRLFYPEDCSDLDETIFHSSPPPPPSSSFMYTTSSSSSPSSQPINPSSSSSLSSALSSSLFSSSSSSKMFSQETEKDEKEEACGDGEDLNLTREMHAESSLPSSDQDRKISSRHK
ncbi:letm1 family protein [Cystoisospora suis]|uniref:Letm1 family protein n=1 Tax=Cystoisospora suis TaxID=483139 RepID=A0A2C6L914_9APIC|nr:letm1 family protein [Cystoisospora suis]